MQSEMQFQQSLKIHISKIDEGSKKSYKDEEVHPKLSNVLVHERKKNI